MTAWPISSRPRDGPEGVFGPLHEPMLQLRPTEVGSVCCAGKLQADAAAAAGVKVFVFSTLENVEERTQVITALEAT